MSAVAHLDASAPPHRSALSMEFLHALEDWNYADAFRVHCDDASEAFPFYDYKLRRLAMRLISGDYELERPIP